MNVLPVKDPANTQTTTVPACASQPPLARSLSVPVTASKIALPELTPLAALLNVRPVLVARRSLPLVLQDAHRVESAAPDRECPHCVQIRAIQNVLTALLASTAMG